MRGTGFAHAAPAIVLMIVGAMLMPVAPGAKTWCAPRAITTDALSQSLRPYMTSGRLATTAENVRAAKRFSERIGQDENYLQVLAIAPIPAEPDPVDVAAKAEKTAHDEQAGARGPYPRLLPSFRGGFRPEEAESILIEIWPGDWIEVPLSAYRAIMRESSENGLPGLLLFRLAHTENGTFDAKRVVAERAGGYSYGAFQIYSRGLGVGYTLGELMDPIVNARIAASEIRRRLDLGQSMYEAMEPWWYARERVLK
jgi:hypothetical protein